MANNWGDDEVNEWGDAPAGAAPAAPAPRKPVDRATAFGRGAAQGATLGFGDEISGLIQAAIPMGDNRSFAERYRAWRDVARGENKQAEQDHKGYYVGGNLVGGIAPTVLLPFSRAAQGAGTAARAGAGALGGAQVGALSGVGGSEADSLAGIAADAGVGAAGGAVLGGAVSAAAPAVASWLAEKSTNLGRKALSGVGTALSARKPIPAAAVEEAYASGAIRPLAGVEGIAKRLGLKAEDLGQVYGNILKDLEAKGVTGPNAHQMAQEMLARATAAEENSLGSAVPGLYRDAADEIVTKPLLGQAPGGDLALSRAEAIKRQLQAAARREYDKISRQYTEKGEFRKDLAAMFRENIEKSVDDQASKAPAEAAAFQPVKRQLSNTLEALKHAEEGAARAARRKPISLTDTIVGGAVGAHTGNPLAAAGGAVLHSVIDHRLPATAGSLARYGSKALQALDGTGASTGAPATPTTVQALVNALRRRVAAEPVPAWADEEGR